MQSPIRVANVTNIPAPYRVPVLNCLAKDPGIELQVFYAARREPDRDWDLPQLLHAHRFMREAIVQRANGKFVHNNPEIYRALREFRPEVVITNGFNPTHLYAFVYAQLHRCHHIAMTDGTLLSEAHLSSVHRLVRRIVIKRSSAFLAASNAGRQLLIAHGAPRDKIRLSPLCANTSVDWQGIEPCMQNLDLLFSGRLVELKNPGFALEVAQGVAARVGRRVSLALLGSGPLESQLRLQAAAMAQQVEVRIMGNVPQREVPRWFAGARVFLFPTSWDPWGVVANEACLAGVPTVISPNAGAAGELIVDGQNGYIRSLQLNQWIDAAAELISNKELHAAFARQSRLRVRPYSFENAAAGIAEAVRMAIAHTVPQVITGR